MKYFSESLAVASGLEKVVTGDEIKVKVDLLLGHDGTWPKVLNAWKETELKLAEGKKFIITVDHAYPAPTVEDRAIQKEMAEICKDGKCELYNHGEGVLHQVIAESEDLKPGMILVGADGHVATAGARGAIAFSVSGDKLVPSLNSGLYSLKVPEVVTIYLEGELKDNVMARDVALYLLGRQGDTVKGKAVALKGTYINNASMDSKMTICNLMPEAGAVTAYVEPEGYEDEGSVITVDVSDISQLLAAPPGPTNVHDIEEFKGKKITVAIIGGCSAGRMEDMLVTSEILKGNKVPEDLTLIVTPASNRIADEMEKQGITKIIRDSGAVIMPPGCGPCPGKHFGVLSPDDVAITTTIRNSPGRIGSKEAEIYLASPYTVAKAAIKGEI